MTNLRHVYYSGTRAHDFNDSTVFLVNNSFYIKIQIYYVFMLRFWRYDSVFDTALNVFDKPFHHGSPSMILCGDFNIPGISVMSTCHYWSNYFGPQIF